MSPRDKIQKILYILISPFVSLLVKTGITPNMITTIGLIINIGAAVVFILGAEFGEKDDLSFIGWGCGVILFAGLFDMLDGQVARSTNKSTRFGALYDSVLDRYSELIMFLGICYYLVAHHYFISSLFAFVALVGSMMVSYVRARSEGIGIECKEGFMQRPERIIIISVSGIICGMVSAANGGNKAVQIEGIPFNVLETISIFTTAIIVVAVFSNITAIGRILHVREKLLKTNG